MALKGFIAYCPDLDLYHYCIEGQVDEKFTTDQLELTIAAHLAENREREAQFMATLCALAKSEPHKKVSLTDEPTEGAPDAG